MIATTIEQSKRLLACGVKAETADMSHRIFVMESTGKKCGSKLDATAYSKAPQFYGERREPAWSLSALLTDVLPRECDGYNCKLFISPWGNNGWSLRYHNDLLVNCRIEGDIDMIEACVKMVELLHEKGIKF